MDAAILDATVLDGTVLDVMSLAATLLDAAFLDAVILDVAALDVVNAPYTGDFGCFLDVMNFGCYVFGCCVPWILRLWMLQYGAKASAFEWCASFVLSPPTPSNELCY